MEESHHRSAGRLEIFGGCGFQSAHLDTGDHFVLISPPQIVLGILEEHHEEILFLAPGELCFVDEAVLPLAYGVESVACRSYEQIAVGILDDALHTGLLGIGKLIAHEAIMLIVVPAEALGRAYPQTMLAVGHDARDIIARYGGGVVAIGEVMGEAVAVELVQSILSGHPDKSVGILRHIANHAARQLVGCIEPSKIGTGRSACQEQDKRQQQPKKPIDTHMHSY